MSMEKGKRGKARNKKTAPLPYSAKLNQEYLDDDFKQRLKEAFVNKKPFQEGEIIIILNLPFPIVRGI